MRDLIGRKAIPDIRQSEATECGLACLAMLLGYYGHDIDLGTLRRRHPTSLNGLTLKGLIGLSARMELTTRALRLEPEQLGQLKLPAILHWEMDHFVVLTRVCRGGDLVLHDPASGLRRVSAAEASRRFTGVALEASPTSQFKRRDEHAKLRLVDLLGTLRGFGFPIMQILILSLLLQLYVLASPFFMQIVVDDAVGHGDRGLLLTLALGFGLLVVLNAMAGVLRGLVLQHIQSAVSMRIGFGLFRHLIRLPYTYFEKRDVGSIVSRLASADTLRNMLAEGMVSALVDGAMAILTMIMMLVYAPTLAGFVMASLLIYIVLRVGLFPALRRRSYDLIAQRARETSALIEGVRAIQTIKISGAEAEREGIWANRRVDVVNAECSVGRLQTWFTGANTFLFGIENIMVVYFGAQGALDGRLTLGMLVAFVAYKAQFAEKAVKLMDKAVELRMLGLHLQRLADIALAEPEPGLDLPLGHHAPMLGALEGRNLGFRYAQGEPLIFENVNFRVAPGEHVAISGPSGCGKTTLLRIMLGLLQPTEGEILADGIPLAALGPQAFRSQIGVVMQDDTLQAGSLADNICGFDETSDLRHMQECALLAGIHEEIMRMPMTYNTLIGDMGSALSAGQKQRVLLARALYRRPRILFIDEGTSHLDVQLEERVNRAIQSLGLTRISIAHRPQTLASADRILDLSRMGLGIDDHFTAPSRHNQLASR